MSKVTMPEPVGWISRIKTIGPDYGKEIFGKLPVQSLNPLTYEHEPLITTTQAEAYKDDCVRAALEEVAGRVEQYHPKVTPEVVALAIRLIAITDGLIAPPQQ